MSKLMLHCGGKPATKEELDLVPLPSETATYKPVSHFALTERVLSISQDLLKGYALASESYGLAREGCQLFALATFRNGDEEMGLSLGWRNSYDKSLTVGFACGANVFVCDNLALSGDVSILRKHTGGIWAELEDRLLATCYRATKQYEQISISKDKMKEIAFDDRKAFQVMGELYGNNIISPRQLSVVKAEWLKPSHEVFEARTAWSLYNANTEALKSSPPAQVMENHIELSKWFAGNVIDITPAVN